MPGTPTSGGSTSGTSTSNSIEPSPMSTGSVRDRLEPVEVGVLATDGNRVGLDRDDVDTLAAGRLADQLRDDRQGGVGELAGHVGGDADQRGVDVDAWHQCPDLVEGVEGDVLVDVDTRRHRPRSGPRCLRTFCNRELAPATWTRLGSAMTGPSSMPSGSRPWSTWTGISRDTTSSTRIGYAAGRVVHDSHTRVGRKHVDGHLDRLCTGPGLHAGQVDAGAETVVGQGGGDVGGSAELDVVDHAGVIKERSAQGALSTSTGTGPVHERVDSDKARPA